jgi:HEAT repeat protein
MLRQWVVSIKTHHRQGVEGAQSALLAQESRYGEKLKTLAREDSDPRVRAFTISLLSRMQSRPAEEFFIERLEDPEQYPRTSALVALEQAGGAACLPAVDRLASSDPVPEVRAAAGKTAKAVRSR